MSKKTRHILSSPVFFILIAGAFALTSCATPPEELEEARATYQDVADGPAGKYAPAELQTAKDELDRAEKAFENEGDSKVTRAFAYSAIRRAKIASLEADVYLARQQKQQTEKAFIEESQKALAAQRQQLEDARQTLRDMRGNLERAKKEGTMSEKELEAQRKRLEAKKEALAEEQTKLAVTQSELENERQRRKEAEEGLAEARSKLQDFAQIDESKDKMVITLTGEVLFQFDESTLRNRAKARLDQVAQVLLADRDREITVVGHTDSQGKKAYNQKLSQNRAGSVRDYLIGQGIASDRIRAVGKAESDPISTNETSDGRAMNRRVEIVVDKGDTT